MTATLADHPDWRYLLREIDALYRHQSAGGSAVIRSHQREVRTTLNRHAVKNPPVVLGSPATKPVCAHLNRAIDNARRERTAGVVAAIDRVREQLAWQYGYDKVPKALSQKFAFAEIAGPRGPVVIEDLILGVVLFAPRCTYPAHSHDEITESYVCLSGWASENDVGVYAPGSMIYNPIGHTHRITTGDFEPTLLAYAWIGPAPALRDLKMMLPRRRRT
jgi:dimethylpropiothetin dethiomethylase